MGKYKWKDSKSSLSQGKYDASDLIITDPVIQENMTFKEMKDSSPTKFIYRVERWCPHCGNAESYVKNIKKISSIKDKPFTQLVLKTIEEKNMKNFTVNDVLKELGAENISDGTLQRRALVALSCLGYIKKEEIEFQDENKKKKFKIVHNRNSEIKLPKCYNAKKDNHILDWETESVETKHFWKGRETLEVEENEEY